MFDNGDKTKMAKSQGKLPIFYSIAGCTNIAVIFIAFWGIFLFRGRSGMEGMFDILIPISATILFATLGIILNLIGMIRGEYAHIIHHFSQVFSVVMAILICFIILSIFVN
jgi:hypothetical protein